MDQFQSPMQLKPGTTLQGGRYKIINTLGQSRFCITYLAEQVVLHRKVAVKEFFMKDCCERDEATGCITSLGGLRDDVFSHYRAKFIHVARMVAGMVHPNIVKIHNLFGENGTAYCVMEFIPSLSLDERVKKGGPFSERLAELRVRQVADALGYIHSRNVVNLDVKPSNIIVDKLGHVVLNDFGLYDNYESSLEDDKGVAEYVISPYAPIEMYRATSFTPATDIYMLGATLYYLVTGSVPPRTIDIVEYGLDRPKGISDKIWAVIQESMEPRPKRRLQNVDAFLAVLRQQMVVPFATNRLNGHEWVDLGLSVKWATCNVGASSPSDYGSYFAWGETTPKSEYTWENYRFRLAGDSYYDYANHDDYDDVTFSKYNTKRSRGTVDNRTRLELSDDAARANWGGSWRMPTDAEWTELRTKCTWTWTTKGGKDGYKVTSKTNGNSIFLPAAGFPYGADLDGAGSYGYYWSSSLFESYPKNAWRVAFDSGVPDRTANDRCYGQSVRPVTE